MTRERPWAERVYIQLYSQGGRSGAGTPSPLASPQAASRALPPGLPAPAALSVSVPGAATAPASASRSRAAQSAGCGSFYRVSNDGSPTRAQCASRPGAAENPGCRTWHFFGTPPGPGAGWPPSRPSRPEWSRKGPRGAGGPVSPPACGPSADMALLGPLDWGLLAAGSPACRAALSDTAGSARPAGRAEDPGAPQAPWGCEPAARDKSPPACVPRGLCSPGER